MLNPYPYPFGRTFQAFGKSLLDTSGRMQKDRIHFLQQNGNMTGLTFDACFDSCRSSEWSSIPSVRETVEFVRNWMSQNPEEGLDLLYEHPLELTESYRPRFELPHIHYDHCPQGIHHRGTVEDLGGRIRCAHLDKQWVRPSFLLEENGWIEEREPHDPTPEDAWEKGELDPIYKEEYQEFLEDMDRYWAERPSLEITMACYWVISDENVIIPLETIFNRISRSMGTGSLFTYCSGGQMAQYVQRWHEQVTGDEMPSWFEEQTILIP